VPAFVQVQRFNNFGTAGQSTITTGSFTALGADHAVVGYITLASGITITSITDNAGNTYNVSSGTVFDAYGVTQFRFSLTHAKGGATTLTVAASAAIGANNNLVFLEYSNVNRINAETTAWVNSSTASPISTNLTSTDNRSTIVGIGNDDGTSAAAGSGFTSRLAFVGGDVAEDQQQASAGTIAVAFTQVGATQGMVIHAWALSPETFFKPRRRRLKVPKVFSKSPIKQRHRFPAWLKQQGAYWLYRKPKRLRLPKQKFIRHPRQHRFPAWLVQQGAYWIHRKKKVAPHLLIKARPKRKSIAWLVISAAQFLFPPSKAWNWNGQAALFNLSLGTVSKAWNWNAQAALLNLTLGTVSKAWVWAKNAPAVGLALGTVSKAWNWARNTIPGLPFTLGVSSKAWNWVPRPAIIISTSIKKIAWNIMRPVLWGILRGEEERPRKGP
jgi:hypothetical protein